VGIATLVSKEPNISVVALCLGYRVAEEKAKETHPDVILMDAEIQEVDCAQSTRCICRMLPKTKVIMLTHSTESHDLLNAIKAGAIGYVTKYISAKDLIRTVTLAYDGEAIIDSSLAEKLFAEFPEPEATKLQHRTRFNILSKRELEVLEMVAKGATNKEIANHLFISEHTVKVHLRNIMAKLHIHNRQQAIAMAIQDNLEPLKMESMESGFSQD